LVTLIVATIVIVLAYYVYSIFRDAVLLNKVTKPDERPKIIARIEKEVEESLKKKNMRRYRNRVVLLCKSYYQILRTKGLDGIERMSYIKRLLASSEQAANLLDAKDSPDFYQEMLLWSYTALGFLDPQRPDIQLIQQAFRTLTVGLQNLDAVEMRSRHWDILDRTADVVFDLGIISKDTKYFKETIKLLEDKRRCLDNTTNPWSYIETSLKIAGAYNNLSDIEDPAGNLDRMLKIGQEVLQIKDLKMKLPAGYALALACVAEAHTNLAEISDRDKNLKTAHKMLDEELRLMESTTNTLSTNIIKEQMKAIEKKLKSPDGDEGADSKA